MHSTLNQEIRRVRSYDGMFGEVFRTPPSFRPSGRKHNFAATANLVRAAGQMTALNSPVGRNLQVNQLRFADTMSKINLINRRTILKEVKRRVHVRAAMDSNRNAAAVERPPPTRQR